MNIEFKLSNFQKRIFAFLIDEFLVFLIFFIAFYKEFSFAGENEALKIAMALMSYYMFIQISYQFIFVWLYSASIGKIIFKIRCINLSGQKPTLLEAFSRSVFRLIGQQLFYIGFIWAFFNPLKQGIHDIFARTLVVERD